MAIYRALASDGVAWITGGSTGMGRALALDLARAGFTVAVTAREHDPIDSLVEEASGLPGRVLSFACDVTDEAGMARTVERIETEAGPIALAVFNAGTYLPTHGEDLNLPNFRKTYEVNLFGVLNGLVPAVHRMQARSRGQVLVIGSVTSYFGWPTGGSYGATKAALNNMAEALRYDFEKMNIRIQVINPGFVATPLSAKNDFPMPFLMPAGEASKRILKAIRSGGFETTFPRRMTWWLKLVRLFPSSFIFHLIGLVTGWKGRPLVADRPPQKLE